jgi:hypothetical protein
VIVSPGARIEVPIVNAVVSARWQARPAGVAGAAAPIASLTEMTVSGSVETEVFLIVTVKVTLPEGSLTWLGAALLVTWIVGATSVTVTLAVAVSSPVVDSLSVTTTWAVLPYVPALVKVAV